MPHRAHKQYTQEFLESILSRKIETGAHRDRAIEAKEFLEKMYPELFTANPYGFSVKMEPTGEAGEFNGKGSFYLCITYNEKALEEEKELFYKFPEAIISCPIGFRKLEPERKPDA